MKESDISLLISYLKHGYSIQEALAYFPQAYKVMKDDLEQGTPFEQLLIAHLPKALRCDFKLYVKLMSVELALEAALKHQSIHHELLKELRNKSIYPIFLFLMAFALLQLFSRFIVPLMLSSFSMIDTNDVVFKYIKWMNLLCNGIIFFMIIVIGVCCLCIFPKIRKQIILFCAGKCRWISIYVSYRFVSYLYPFIIQGIPTIDFILHMNEHSSLWIGDISQRIDAYLNEGIDFKNAFIKTKLFDDEWIQCMERGLSLSRFEEMSKFYLCLSKERLLLMVKKLTILIQATAYIFIALLVVLVFQMMMLPLSILQTI
jgi:type II secretory pathway component PulF